MPTPRPDTLVIFCGGGEAGREDELLDLRFRHLVELGLGREPVGQRLVPDPLDVEAAAVVGDADDDVAALVIGGQADDALLRLAGGDPVGARLQAVIGGVAHHVGERVLDPLQHLAVELGVGAVHLKLDVLAELGRQIAHDARQLLPGVADRLHARAHDAVLQLGGDIGEPLQRHLEFGIRRGGARCRGAGCASAPAPKPWSSGFRACRR